MDDESDGEYEDQTFTFGPHAIVASTIVELGLEALCELEANSDEISGQRAWPGSLLLCSFLLDAPAAVSGLKVLELGAGCGVCAMLAAKLGAANVVASDGDDRCLKRLRDNVAKNFGGAGACHAAELLWGDDDSLARFKSAHGTVFDVTLAGDVLYKHALVAPFVKTLAAVVSPGGTAYLCHLPRAGVEHIDVTLALDTAGFDLEVCAVRADLVVDGADCSAEDAQNAKLYKLTRRA
ncbi:S-adenosyl-L-methionine-dependent methyltransferase [Pelagophyceae sp. CCMP2097]|nr:S-adenosyl-L-methionine-dependent methyltransferase [Pelagophyceae sp. CCMP2097]